MHLSSGRNESEIPSLNKKAYEFIYNKTGYYAKPDQSLSKRKYNFDPIGMKNIHLKLVVPKTVSLFHNDIWIFIGLLDI